MVTELIHSFLILHHGLVLFSLERRPVWPKHDLVCMIRVQHPLAGKRETPFQETRGPGLAAQDEGQAYLELQRVGVIGTGGEVSVYAGTPTEGTPIGRLFVIAVF